MATVLSIFIEEMLNNKEKEEGHNLFQLINLVKSKKSLILKRTG